MSKEACTLCIHIFDPSFTNWYTSHPLAGAHWGASLLHASASPCTCMASPLSPPMSATGRTDLQGVTDGHSAVPAAFV